ncbi:hypothetical protein OHB54_13445 [Streptomyces sp. NBC_01007]|nr:hypothetical protein OHB54_13445 [Streptomyces sp. NBC_01007]
MDAEASPLPWFGPTLHELVPDSAPGTPPPRLRRQTAQALAAARKDRDPARLEALQQAKHASHNPVLSLVAEMLTPPLPRHHTEELP